MKSFHSLIEQIQNWRRKRQHEPQHLVFPVKDSSNSPNGKMLEPQAISQGKTPVDTLHKIHPPFMALLAIASLTSIVGYRFYNQPRLAVGTKAPETIVAPSDGSFEDIETTEAMRRAIRTGIVPTLKQDKEITAKIELKVAEFLQQVGKIRQITGSFPFLPLSSLSLSSQSYLRQCNEQEWQAILAVVEKSQSPSNRAGRENQSSNPAFQKALTELQQEVSPQKLATLIPQINQARQRYARGWEELSQIKIPQLSDSEKNLLLDLDQETWQKTKAGILQSLNKILTQGIVPGLPPNLIAQTVQIQLSTSVPEVAQPLSRQLLIQVLEPNLVENKEETKRLAEQAVQAVEPVIVEVQNGEVIVEAGETITQGEFVVLDAFGLSRRSVNWTGLAISGILVTGSVVIFCLSTKRVHRPMRRRDHVLLCLLSLSAPMLVTFGVPYTDLPAIGLLVSSFYSPGLALTQVALLTGLTTFSVGAIGWEYLLSGAAGGLLAAAIAGKLRSREELALLGGAVGLTQGVVYLTINLILSAAAGTIWYAVLPGAIIYGVSGLAWIVFALGISPYLERLFDLVTPIRLAELSNPNRPLLKRLATEAPGTFQHTMFVCCLAEAAARELNCDVELVRAGTLYHDIGKLHDPKGFIENQMGGPNKHDRIKNPWRSAKIIKEHVSEGLVMARKANLPKAVRDFIPEHQGTLLISYFYFQAKHQAEERGSKPVLESNFRYDGPIPQSRETGILMLADGCEAALRSLKDATPEEALCMIHKIFKARWRDNQLADSGLRYEELPQIAEIFVRVWQQYHHQRIAYPKAALEPQIAQKSGV